MPTYLEAMYSTAKRTTSPPATSITFRLFIAIPNPLPDDQDHRDRTFIQNFTLYFDVYLEGVGQNTIQQIRDPLVAQLDALRPTLEATYGPLTYSHPVYPPWPF